MLEALLAGPTAEEQPDGYDGWFSDATADALRSVTIEGGDGPPRGRGDRHTPRRVLR